VTTRSPALTPRISVVVPTYQRRDVLARTLPTLLRQEVAAGSLEVVVVVDGSTDGTAEMLAALSSSASLRVLVRPNGGPAAARNAGIAAARGELVLLLDDDLLCPPGLVAAHLAAHGEGARVVFGPVLGLPGGGTAADLVRLELERYYARMRDEWDPDTSPTAYAAPNTSLPRAALLHAGGFDVRFARAYEDADLGLRLRAMGLPFTYLPAAPVQQLYTKSARALAVHDAAAHGAGEVLLCRTHPGQRRHASLATLGEGGVLRRAVRAAAAESPLPPEWLLRPPFSLVERLPSAPMRRLRLSLLSRRGYAARLRAAAEAAGGWGSLTEEFGRRCPALLYHHVGPPPAGMPAALTITPERFERQVRYLARRGFTGITAGRWLEWLETGAPLPPRPFVLTFDDAYADLAAHAFPVLRRQGFGATVYVVTGRIGGTSDWDGERGVPPLPLLRREQITEWSREGIEFGAHTRTHPALGPLPEAAVREEVRGGRAELEAATGAPVRSFAYPYGGAPPSARTAAAEAYALSFTLEEGVNTLATDPHLHRRTMVQPSDTLLDLELRARFGRSPLSEARARLRLRSRVRALLRRP
jgi:GT2 family glycosyltransferase/peptidoglycan/xylan/chitin deacetylase (PgdA/CDA1 family)